MNDNIISINVPNIVTIGLILALWSLIFAAIGQLSIRARRAQAEG